MNPEKNQQKGNLYVISGFSGTGKGTVMEAFRHKPGYFLSVSCTSRKPRDREVEGVNYYFISHEEFMRRAEAGFFLEHAVFSDHGYGTPREPVERHLSEGTDVLLEIEVQGAFQIRKQYPDAILIFMTPPSIAELKKRLAGRDSENPEEIRKRLLRAVEEGRFMEDYDYIVINDELDACIREMELLMSINHCRSHARVGFIEDIRSQLDEMKGVL